MKSKSLAWLLYATILTGAPAFAADGAAETLPAVAEEATEAKPTSPAKIVGALSLQQAIDRAISSSPRLKSSQAAYFATKGTRYQAGAWANPGIGVEVENFGGKNSMKGFDSTETTVGISQLVEIGGKRSARTGIADQSMTLAQFDQEAARLDLIRDVQLAYTNAVAAQEQIKIAEDEKERATAMLKTVKLRVGAAREPLIQQSKAEVTFASSEIGVEQAKRQLVAAKKALASLWGSDETFILDSSDFFEIAPPVVASENLKKNPDIARYDNELLKSKAAFDLEKANAIPDPTISAGIRDFRDTGDKAFVAGISFPIPIFNANRGNIERARQELSKTEFDKDTSALSINTNLVKETSEMETSYQQALALKEKILPSAEKAFRLSREGYGVGKFPYLEVLDAQRTLFDTREQYLTTLKTYHTSKAEVERLTAAHAADKKSQEQPHE
jgi:cobalt-zinc-cadmium efflux system outer membrane protein